MKCAIRLFTLAVTVSIVVARAEAARLRVEATVVSKSTFGSNDGLAGSGQCDRNGNLYARVFDPAEPRQARPVLMFDKAGTLQTKFASPHLPELQHRGSEFAFAALPHGGIAVADWGDPGVYVVMFSSEGKVKSDVKLDFAGFIPYQLAVFPAGELFLSGIEDGDRSHPSRYKSFAAVYDKNGHLVKQLRVDGDQEIDRAIELGDSRYASFGAGSGNSAAANSMAATGSDGNVYLVRQASPVVVYVISPSGDVVRKVAVEPRTPGDVPFEMRLARGEIALVFDGWNGNRSSGNSRLTVLDAHTGERLQDFEGGVAGSGFSGLSCYAPDSGAFTFLSISKARHMEITTAKEKR